MLFTSTFYSHAQKTANKTHRPKVALVLSGGGAKGFAHIGVLKVLEEEGIPIDIIVGTSMGSLIGGIYAIGYDASSIDSIVKSLNWEKLFSDDVPRGFLSNNDKTLKQRYYFSFPINEKKEFGLPKGLIKGHNVLNLFCGLAGNVPKNADFEKFPISFACVATNLETGAEVVLKNGFLPTAMFSSMAIPIAFQPSDRDGLLLVDGGLVNNFPTDVAKKMGADIIIGVDIQNDGYDRKSLQSISNVLDQLTSFFDQSKDSTNKSYCNLIIRPDITGYNITSFNNKAVDTLILRGEKAANGLRKQIREIKEKYNLHQNIKSRELVKPDKWHFTELTFNGNYHLEKAFLQKTMKLKIPGDYSSENIKNAIDRLYGLGGFERIYYDLAEAENGKILNINIITKNIFTYNIGFKANTTDAAAILLNYTRKNYGNTFGLLSTSAELSVNPGLSILAESNKTNFLTFGISLKGKRQNYNVFEKGSKIFEADIFYTSGSIYLYQPILKLFNLGLGLQEEYYRGDIFSKKDNYPIMWGKTNNFITSAYSYLSFDNMDDFYFPRKGTNLYAEFALNSYMQSTRKICPTLLFRMNNVMPLTKNMTFLLDIYGRAMFQSNYLKMTIIGGEAYSQYFNNHLPFVGLPSVSIAERFAYIGLVGLRVKASKSQYVSILFNGLDQGENTKPWANTHYIFGGGIKYSMKTFFGPLDMTLGYSDSSNRLCFSANYGYWF
jgi:NTE family protein